MTVSLDTPIGTRVFYNMSTMSDLYNGDVGTVVGKDYHNVSVRMDDSRGRRARDLCGASAHWTTSGGDFSPVEPAVGDTVAIVADGHSDAHGLSNGTEAQVVSLTADGYGDNEGKRITVSVEAGTWGPTTYFVLPSDVVVTQQTAEVPETLEFFKVKFLTLAVERAAENGGVHPEQVKTLLDEFARSEFLDPAADLDTFKARVVALAFEGKKRHGWCPEPERFLNDLGLGHLLPVTKSITLVVTVDVQGESTLSRNEWRDLARNEAATLIAGDKWNLSVPTGTYTIENMF